MNHLDELWKSIAKHRSGDAFWIAEILLDAIRRETGYDGDKAALKVAFGEAFMRWRQ